LCMRTVMEQEGNVAFTCGVSNMIIAPGFGALIPCRSQYKPRPLLNLELAHARLKDTIGAGEHPMSPAAVGRCSPRLVMHYKAKRIPYQAVPLS
jgi:hypothetical protein